MSAPIRVLLVEDNDVFRETLELLLGLRSDVEVIRSVADGSAAAGMYGELKPDVVLMDYRLPGLDGAAATAAVRSSWPEAAVVCLTGATDGDETRVLYEAGAVACLSKDLELDTIVEALHTAAGRPRVDARS